MVPDKMAWSTKHRMQLAWRQRSTLACCIMHRYPEFVRAKSTSSKCMQELVRHSAIWQANNGKRLCDEECSYAGVGRVGKDLVRPSAICRPHVLLHHCRNPRHLPPHHLPRRSLLLPLLLLPPLRATLISPPHHYAPSELQHRRRRYHALPRSSRCCFVAPFLLRSLLTVGNLIDFKPLQGILLRQ
jgi:hypothetical protein